MTSEYTPEENKLRELTGGDYFSQEFMDNLNSLNLTVKEANIVINQIKLFFKADIYNRINDYEWLCQFEGSERKHDKKITLKNLLSTSFFIVFSDR